MKPRSRGQAMVEFALILPIVLGIIFISISVALAWDVRIQEHKLAYDIARHVAKQEPVKADGTNDFSHDLVTGCYPNSSTPDLKARNQADGQAVINYHFQKYHDLGLAQSMASQPEIDSITTGPDLPVGTLSGPDANQAYGGGGYYCNMSITVTLKYRLTIPGWEVLSALYGGQLGDIKETAVAARLQGQYE
jgi:hypothetical protein